MSATRQKTRPPVNNAAGRPQLPPTAAFCIFALANLVAAVFSPIQDCDEVFNYWEPSHYLNHGYGLQTWEYSPDYAIRSWAYTGIHSLVMWAGTLPIQPLALRASKVLEFYFLRMVLAVACAVCQTRMYSAIRTTFQERIAIFFMMIMVISPGMYHAAPAYLPSSFAMYFAMLGFASFMDWYGGLIRTAQGITWFAVGSALGWPFAGALALPFILEDVIVGFVTSTLQESLRRLLFQGATRAFAILALQTAIDSFFYRKLVCVPLNIVLYNVFSGGSRGPDIYGVEPWHFYVRNLALNFNIWFFLALAALPLLLIQHLVFDKSVSKHTLRRSVVFVSPFYLWLAIFTVQPHKEERFMYPAYPALAWNAALSLHIILANFGSNDPRHLVSKIPPSVKLVIVCIPLLLSFNLGMLRTVGHMTAYSAPLAIYKPLLHSTIAHPGTNVCLGKEWYRFPSSFNLPHGVHAKFIKSEFSGLLPGEFSTATDTADGFFPGTHVVPPGMNDENLEDVGKYIDVQHCDFLVDSRIPGQEPTALEPDYAADTQHWETKLVWHLTQRNEAAGGARPATPTNLEKRPFKAPEREFGVWDPVPFTRPRAAPYPNWNLHTTKPLPYRPFRHGPKYNITMGLRTMHWDEWIELDNDYLSYHSLKAARIAARGEKCIKTDPKAWDAAVELLEEMAGYLKEVFDVGALTRNGVKEDPMALCSRLVQDDLAIMLEGEDGQYYLLAGSILLAGFWKLEDKFGMGLSEIHTSAHVPGFKQKLEKGMTNFFRRVQPQAPVLRNNYFIQVDDNLAWSDSIGPEDGTNVASIRGVVFTIRTYFLPITSIAQEPYVPGRLASAVRSWGDDVSRYKGKDKYGDVLLDYLDRKHAEQVAAGLDVEREEDIRAYPY
ncbi:hypothetical protein CFE70_000945 [Pyrenophora teres f. teres 0-1]